MPYPTTPQELIDRILVDDPFLIQLVVSDNYPAVLTNALQLGIVRNRVTPDDLKRALILLDNPEGSEQLAAALDVPFRGATSSRVLDGAMAQMRDRVQQSGTSAKGFFALDGIAALANAVGNIANGQASIEAQERIASQQLQQQAVSDAARSERNAKLIKWGIGITAVVVVVLVIVWLKTRSA